MIAHATIGRQHVVLADPAPGAAARCIREGCSCPHCGADLWDSGEITRPRRHDRKAGYVLRCRGGGSARPCGGVWAIRAGAPMDHGT